MSIFKSLSIISLTLLVTIIVDLINMRYYSKIQGILFNILNSTQTKAVYTFLKINILFIFLLIFISIMSSYTNNLVIREKSFWQKTGDIVYALMIIGYMIILLFPVIQLISPGTEKSNFTNKQQQIFLTLFLVLFFVAVMIAFIDWKPRFYLGKLNYFLIYVPILFLVNFFLQFSSALWRHNFQETVVSSETFKAKFLSFLLILPIYLLFFSAPRFLLLSKSFHWLSFVSAVVSTLFFAWKSAAYL